MRVREGLAAPDLSGVPASACIPLRVRQGELTMACRSASMSSSYMYTSLKFHVPGGSGTMSMSYRQVICGGSQPHVSTGRLTIQGAKQETHVLVAPEMVQQLDLAQAPLRQDLL